MSQEIIAMFRDTVPGYHHGWGGPEYTSWQDEQMSWKTTCYIGDWSFLMDIEVRGREALAFFRDTSINGYAKFDIGQAKHLVQCTERGKVVGEGVLMRVAEDVFRTQSTTAMWSSFLLKNGHWDAQWRVIDTFQFQVSGPTALATCETVCGENLSDIGFMRFRKVTIAGAEVFALRQGMAGEIGFEFHGDAADAAKVHAAILAAGQPFGIRRLGHRTAMINHLEAAFPTGLWHYIPDMFAPEAQGFYEHTQEYFDVRDIRPSIRGSYEGEDIADYCRSPFELGWGRSVRFDHDFPGRAALEEEVKKPKLQRVTLEFNSDDVVDIYASLFGEDTPFDFLDIPHSPRFVPWADRIESLDTGDFAGISSNPGYSYHFRRVLTLAYVRPEYAEPGTEVAVVWGNPGTPQRRLRATVRSAPYKSDNRRVDLCELAAVAG
jgi:vanillate/3-O-methylgallate O-demethylase